MANEFREGERVTLDQPTSETQDLLEHRGVNITEEFWIVKVFKFAGWLMMAPINSANWFFVKISEVKRK